MFCFFNYFFLKTLFLFLIIHHAFLLLRWCLVGIGMALQEHLFAMLERAGIYVEIEEQEMENALRIGKVREVVTCEAPYGGMLLLNNCILHRSLENHSDKIYWSLDLLPLAGSHKVHRIL